MTAILKHELKSHFHSLTAWVFGAFLLCFVGIGALQYNLNESVSNFEYVLGYCSIILAIIVPLLTMRTIAEERRQKTDQLIYSLPVTTTQVVLGKYLALLILFAIPLLIVCLYPLIFSQYGDVYLPTSYGAIGAFFLMGAALIALGVFISSLTENQGFAAGLGVAVMLANYYSVSLSEYVSRTTLGSGVALAVIAVLLCLLIRYMTKKVNLAYGAAVVLILGLSGVLYFKPELLEGLLPKIMEKLSFFERFYTFVDGVFDLTNVTFYLTAIVFFLFLSVQSLEKRRYN